MSKNRTIFISYIKERLALLIIYTFITAVFLAVTGLYGYTGAVVKMTYAAVIVLFTITCIGLGDFFHYRNKCLKLFDALSKNGESDNYLPNPDNLAETLYNEIICDTEKGRRELISNLDEKKRDMADYYTLWTHQIKTPIAALKLLFQRDETRRSEQEELFKIEQYSEMALYYARLDNIFSDLLLQKQDIFYLVKQAVKKYSIIFIGSKLSFSLQEFTCETVTDAKWLSFVIEQVLSNALKHTREGEIRIYGINQDGSKWQKDLGVQEGISEQPVMAYGIVIEDTGIGIPQSDIPRIFERGFTGYNGRTDKKSTGIGLYLCKQIMDKLSHSIKVESVLGEGTKVMLSLYRENRY